MKVFVTGATGFLGSNIVKQLIAAGHTVTGLARSDASAEKLTSLGGIPVRGTHTDLETLAEASKNADAVIHTAFNHALFAQPNGFIQACEEDRAAIKAIHSSTASGTLGTAGEEETSGKSEAVVASYADRGVRGINLRLSPIHMFITGQVGVAKKSGFVGYVGEGSNVWPSVHVQDAATLAFTAGSNVHAVANEGVPTKEIAEFIAKKMGLETKSIAPDAAVGHWGFLGMVLISGGKTTTKLTQEWTGWTPKEQGLFEELESYTF
ncbi:NAD-dependent epimerase/dehydratase [Flagelloscypha sp. PMI_526]|nr:NAD-dependent epimerase/dehydratase [Flagelloscypha sp. PMI_526]